MLKIKIKNSKNSKSRLPKFKSDQECAEFWDTHDFTDYQNEFKKVDNVVFEQQKIK